MKMRYLFRFLKRKLPHILTALTCIGAVGTGVACVKATWNAKDILRDAEEKMGRKPTPKEVFKLLAPHYIMPVSICVGTMASAIGADVTSSKQKATLIAACVSYREALKQAIDKIPKNERIVLKKDISPGTAKDMYYDPYSDTFVYRSEAEMLKIELELNKIFREYRMATMDDYYELLGIGNIAQAKKLSPSSFLWSEDLMNELNDRQWIEMFYLNEETSDGTKFKTINFSTPPICDYELGF